MQESNFCAIPLLLVLFSDKFTSKDNNERSLERPEPKKINLLCLGTSGHLNDLFVPAAGHLLGRGEGGGESVTTAGND